MLNSQDARRDSKGWVREAIIGNMKCQGMIVKVVHNNENDLEAFSAKKLVLITYAKTFTGGIYADFNDLSQIQIGGADCEALCPDISAVRRLQWT